MQYGRYWRLTVEWSEEEYGDDQWIGVFHLDGDYREDALAKEIVIGENVNEALSTKELLWLAREELIDAPTADKVAVLREICEEFYESKQEDRVSITTPALAVELFKAKLRFLDHEECWIAVLNSFNYCMRIENLTSCAFDIKRIVKSAIIVNGAGILVAHNHPSCNPRPSAADIKQTESLKKASLCLK